MDNRPIGVFDSGLGGLTVLKEIMSSMPGESIVYFGDNGRAPYGNKSKETVLKYTFQDIRFLLNQDIKMIVIACNTASACSIKQVKNTFDIPVIEVIEPGSTAAVRETKNNKVGVIGTTNTINSDVYENAIQLIDNNIQVFSKACPLFVPLAEEGWWENDIAERIAKEYLLGLKEYDIDTLVLGCTHYPILYNTINKVIGPEVSLVSSAQEVARVVKNLIAENNIARDPGVEPVYRYYTSDNVELFESFGSRILGKEIHAVEKVDIEKY